MEKVDKNQFNPELRKAASMVYKLNFLFSNKWTFRHVLYPLNRLSKGKSIKGLQNEERYIDSRSGGPKIRLKIHRPLGSNENLPVMLYMHGGGFAIGCPEQFNEVMKRFIEKRPCIIVSPDYRKSIKAPFPAGFNDCYDTLLWINENAELLGAEKGKIIVAGHSGGGGLAAAVTLKARDTKDVPIAFQMPIYPMLDDRHANESSQLIVPGWDLKANTIGWDFYLEDLKKTHQDIPLYAAPARNTDYRDFPPTISFVGGLEPFKDETIEYFDYLTQYHVPNEFRVFDGCFHGFELLLPKTEIAQEASQFMLDSYAMYYDKYVIG